MDTNTKSIAAVTLLMMGLFTGMNVMISDESNGNWLMWTVLFFVGAFLFFMWIMRDKRSADEAAQEALDTVEENIRKLEDQAQAASMPEKPEETVDGDEVFAAGAAPTTTESETDDSEPSLEERAEESRPETEQVVEEAQNGEPISEAEIAGVTAAPPGNGEVEVTPQDDPEIPDEPDDLTRIEGIGPKYADILIGAGVTTFAQLAAMDTEAIETLVRDNGGRRAASMATWAQQAKLAAARDWDGLDALQAELDGGRPA